MPLAAVSEEWKRASTKIVFNYSAASTNFVSGETEFRWLVRSKTKFWKES
jgi:hypothetical protein